METTTTTNKPIMPTLVSRVFSVEQCRVNFDKIFVFGDSLARVGMGGQAIIREQINSIGIATKKSPSEYFTDGEFKENCVIIEDDINKVKAYAEQTGAKAIVFPKYGIGTGLSAMQRMCPKTFCYLTTRLIEEFSFNNIEFLQSKPM